jgi:hypothetical protein
MQQGVGSSLEFSEAEWDSLSQLSATAGLTVQEFVRLKLLDQAYSDAATKLVRQAAIFAQLANKFEFVCQIIYSYGRKPDVNPEEFRSFLGALSDVLNKETDRLLKDWKSTRCLTVETFL